MDVEIVMEIRHASHHHHASAGSQECSPSKGTRARISLGELIRESLQRTLALGAQRRADDPLFADHACYDGDVERDLSAEHDLYLYEGEEL